jgi:hypothetical protein
MNVALVACLVAAIFAAIKMVAKYTTDVKMIIRDTVVAFVSTLIGMYAYDKMDPKKPLGAKQPEVFTEKPNF